MEAPHEHLGLTLGGSCADGEAGGDAGGINLMLEAVFRSGAYWWSPSLTSHTTGLSCTSPIRSC